MQHQPQQLVDHSTLLASFEDKWVALSPDYTRVLVSGDTMMEVDAQVAPDEKHTIIFYKVPPFDDYYIPAQI